jgi:lactoylglutathione lyase
MQPSRIHHVGLPVSDLDRSVAWYREALGLTHESGADVPGGVAFMVAPAGERLELLQWIPRPSAWDDPIAALAPASATRPGVDDLNAAYARAVEAGGRSVWTPRDTPEPGLRIAFVADPDGNLVELLSSDEEARRPNQREGTCDHETDDHHARHCRRRHAGVGRGG